MFYCFFEIFISLSFLDTMGFLIVPIATSISTWIGVLTYLYLLKKKSIYFYKTIY